MVRRRGWQACYEPLESRRLLAGELSVYDSDSTANQVAENAAAGVTVGITAQANAVAGRDVGYRLLDDAGGRFGIDPQTGVVAVTPQSSIDFETTPQHSLTVEALAAVPLPAIASPAAGTADAVYHPATGQLQIRAAGVALVSLRSAGGHLLPSAGDQVHNFGTAFLEHRPTESLSWLTFSNTIGLIPGFTSTGGLLVRPGTPISDLTLQYQLVGNAAVPGSVWPAAVIDETAMATFAVEIQDANDPPQLLMPGGIAVEENSVALLNVVTHDQDGDTSTVILSGGEDHHLFDFQPSTGALAFQAAPDFEQPADADGDNEYLLELEAADGRGGVSTQLLTVTVTDQLPGPLVDVDLQSDQVGENAGSGANVGVTLQAVAPEGETLRYRLVDDAQGRFTIDSLTGQLTVAGDNLLDHEQIDEHHVVVEALPDSIVAPQELLPVQARAFYDVVTGHLQIEARSTARVWIRSTSGSLITAPLPTGPGVASWETLPSGEPQLSWNTGLSQFLEGRATIAGLWVTPGTPLSDLELTFEDTDRTPTEGTLQARPTFRQSLISIAVLDENEPPQFGPQPLQAVAENERHIGALAVVDPDGDPVQFAVTGGVDQAAIQVDAATGQLAFLVAPDFENPDDFNRDHVYDVEVTVDDGRSGLVTQAVRIAVTDLLWDTVVDYDVAANAVREDAAENTQVGITAAVPFGTASEVEFQLLDDAGGRFAIDAVTGEVVVGPIPLDHESSPEHTLIVAANTTTSVDDIPPPANHTAWAFYDEATGTVHLRSHNVRQLWLSSRSGSLVDGADDLLEPSLADGDVDQLGSTDLIWQWRESDYYEHEDDDEPRPTGAFAARGAK